MHPPLLRRGLAVATVLGLALPGFAAPKPAAPTKTSQLIDVLLRSPEFEAGKLSPDGAHFAFIREVKDQRVMDCYEFKTGKIYRLVPPRESTTHYLPGVQNVSTNIIELPGGKVLPAPPPPPPNDVVVMGVVQQIRNFFWTGSDQLLIQDDGQSLDYSGLWMADGILQKCRKIDSGSNYLVPHAALPQDPNTALLREISAKNRYTPLWRLDKLTQKVYVAEGNPGKVVAWHLDQTGQVRLATVDEKDGNTSTLYRAAGAKEWEPLTLPNQSRPVSFDVSGQNVMVGFPGPGGRRQLQGYDLAAKQFTDSPIADPVYDINPDVICEPKTGMAIGLHYETAKPAILWLNGQFARIHNVLRVSFPGANVQIHGVLETGEVLFTASSDVSPPVLYRYDAVKREIHVVLSALPEAAKTKWAPMQPVSFPARDGTTLYGYLTLPAGRAGQKFPLVALAHDGPAARDSWGFNPGVQFLAGLGYGVLQVNYRGSTGYGQDYALKNSLEVCEKSVDDVVDGIRWAIASGQADPARIAACGENFGGYIALGIATRYPELLAASASVAGIYDWEGQQKYDGKPSAQLLEMGQGFYLDPKASGERYRAFSPVRAADKVRCPVLLLHGGSDSAVEISQVKKMSRALRDARKSVEVVKDAEGAHGLPIEAARRTCYGNLAAFLLKNLPPDPL